MHIIALFKNKTSNGRSMVEMLGVLAIIGILSLAALSGMTYVKNKNEANQLMKEMQTQGSAILARQKQYEDPSGEIRYAYTPEQEVMEIVSRKYIANTSGKTSVVLFAQMRDDKKSKSICKMLMSETKSGVFDCVAGVSDLNIGEIPVCSAIKSECKDDTKISTGCCENAQYIAFIADSTMASGTTGGPIDPCANIICTGNRVCIAGVCQCQKGYHEEDGECVDCGDPKAVCNKTDEQLSVVDTNGCPIYGRKNCPENACNLLTGDCCDLGKTYYKEIEDCCLDDKWAEKAEECCLDTETSVGGYCCPTKQTYNYNNEAACCSDMNTSETCCYAVHIKDNPEYYNADNVTSLLSYKPNDPTQKCQCKNGYDETQKVCCNTGEYSSKGHCCPAGQEWVNGANECMAPCDGIGLTGKRNADYGCECETGLGKGCACPAGQTLIDGQCSRMYCSGGPTHYSCTILGRGTCGYGCNSIGEGCSHGLCYGKFCPEGTEFTYIPSKGYYISQYPYRCEKKFDNDLNCYTVDGKSWICYLGNSVENCMIYSGSSPKLQLGSSTRGLCDSSVCSKYKDSAGVASEYRLLPHPGCYFKADNYYCTYYYGSWSCFKNSAICGLECTDPENCGTCKTENACLSKYGYSWNKTTQRCEDETSYCIPTDETYNKYHVYHFCYNKETKLRCSYHHLYETGATWRSGVCSDPGCSSHIYNGQSMKFGFIKEYEAYGCISADGMMKCTTDGDLSYTKAKCYYGTKGCGYKCVGWNGTDCDAAYLPECSKDGECPQTGYNMTGNDCSCEKGQVTTFGDADYCCPKGHIYLGGVCSMSACADGKYVTSGGICVTADECKAFSMFLSDKMCVEKCPKTQVASEGVCVDACPSGQVVSEGICVNACPSGQFVSDGVCIKSCSASQVLSKGSCVTKCPAGQVISNVCNPKDTTACQNVCVDTCPEGQSANAQNICQ